MSSETPMPVVNHLLERVPLKERLRILEHCDPVSLSFGQTLCEPQQPLAHVYFPLNGFISAMAAGKRRHLEMGPIGNEGMLGATLLLGVDESPLLSVVQKPGLVLRMGATQFRQALSESPALLNTLSRYLYVLTMQIAQTAICVRFHEIEARLARCLLMAHDRTHADHFHLTHEWLADMLGVRRSGVTIAAGVLQSRQLIHYSRGEIRILDRKGLEAASCDCYRSTVDGYARVMA